LWVPFRPPSGRLEDERANPVLLIQLKHDAELETQNANGPSVEQRPDLDAHAVPARDEMRDNDISVRFRTETLRLKNGTCVVALNRRPNELPPSRRKQHGAERGAQQRSGERVQRPPPVSN
jgi:hypothetical protein